MRNASTIPWKTRLAWKFSCNLLRVIPLKCTNFRPVQLQLCLCMSSGVNACNSSDAVVARVAEYIKQNDVRRVVVLAGAGISTASGIPDFRTPGSGLYDNLAQYNLPWPEAVFDLEYFYSNPKPFYALAKELYPSGRYRPNVVHYFIRLLHEQSRLLRVYTQNIDSLERMAGIPDEKLIEAHGTFLTATCIVCRAKASKNLVKDAVERGVVAKCTKCGNVVKPDIVFFGENLPSRFWRYDSDMVQTDLVLVMGTSLEVYPFAGVADVVPKGVPRILFNRELVGTFRFKLRPLDLAILGEVTESVEKLAVALNWKSDLDRLMMQCEAKEKTNGSTSTTSNNGINNNAPRRKYCTYVVPQITGLNTFWRSPSWMKLQSDKRAATVSENGQGFPEQINSQTHSSGGVGKANSKNPLDLLRSTNLCRKSNEWRRSSSVDTCKPEPRDALTILRSYLLPSPPPTSDSESTESIYSFLNASPVWEENFDAKRSIIAADDNQ